MRYLALLPALALVSSACGGDLEPELVPARVQLSVAPSVVTGALETDADAAPAAPEACAGDASYCSPVNLAGRIYKAVVMWGELGPGCHAITLLDGTDGHVDDHSWYGGTVDFSLIDSEILAGSYESVDGSGSRPLPRMELAYDYLDATLVLAGPLAAPDASVTYEVRTVFVTDAEADDVEGRMLRGDKLVRPPGASTWRWCNAAGCSTDRAEVADGLIREAKLVDYVYPGDGNPNYIPFAVPLEPALSLTAEEINTAESLWACAFDMIDAVRLHAPPSAIDSAQALLAAFELAYDPDQSSAGQDEVRMSATVTFVQGDPDWDTTLPPDCDGACATVASCYGFEDGAFGADEAECAEGCGAADDASAEAFVACVAAAECTSSAFEACWPSSE